MTISFKTYLEADAPLPLIAKPQSAQLQPVEHQPSPAHDPNRQVPTPQQPYPQNSHDDPDVPEDSAEEAYEYAKKTGKRNPTVEKYLLRKFKDPYTCYRYAKYILKARWPEAENIIGLNAKASINYVYYVMGVKDRFIAGESAMKRDSKTWDTYVKYMFTLLDSFLYPGGTRPQK
jgi:hypothetical protein